MEKINNLLKEREAYLLKIKQMKETAVEMAPEGKLRICDHKNRVQFYLRKNPEDINGTYIKDADKLIARKIAQKDYDKKVLYAVEKELDAIRKYLNTYPKVSAENVYTTLHKERKKLITPVRESDEEFIQNWEAFIYPGKEFEKETTKFYTEKGEAVRSKSEVIIANLLNKEKIPYRYECPLYLKGLGKVYPDFTVLNVRLHKEFYWEHLGMMDDSIYAENALKKLSFYEKNGIFAGEKFCRTYFLAIKSCFDIITYKMQERGQYMEDTIYSVSEAVKLLEVQSHVLRYWEEEMHLPIGRNEMGHRYYTRCDIQVFLSIKELKKKGYSLKKIGELTSLFYHKDADKVKSDKIQIEMEEALSTMPETTKKDQFCGRISSEFLDIISRIVAERLKEKNSDEARYKRLDQRIRMRQQIRRETAVAAEKNKKKKRGRNH